MPVVKVNFPFFHSKFCFYFLIYLLNVNDVDKKNITYAVVIL